METASNFIPVSTERICPNCQMRGVIIRMGHLSDYYYCENCNEHWYINKNGELDNTGIKRMRIL